MTCPKCGKPATDAVTPDPGECYARGSIDCLRAQLATVTAERDVALLVLDMPRSVFDEDSDVAAEAACAAYDARWRAAGLCGLHPWVSARCAAGPHGLPARALPGCRYASCATHCRCEPRGAK